MLIRVVAGFVGGLVLVALSSLVGRRWVRWPTLAWCAGLAVVSGRFALAWAGQLAAGRAHTEGFGYGGLVLMTPFAVVLALVGIAPLAMHLVAWRAQRSPPPPLEGWRRVVVVALSLAALLCLVGVARPEWLQPERPLPVVGVAYTRRGDELLAWDTRGEVRRWNPVEQHFDARWTLGLDRWSGVVAVSPFDCWLVVPWQGGTRLLSLPDGGGSCELLSEQRGHAWAFPGAGLAAVADGAHVEVFQPGGATPARELRWPANVTALAGIEDGTLVVADSRHLVTWLDARTLEPSRSVTLEDQAHRMSVLGGGPLVLVESALGRAVLVNPDEPSQVRPLERRRRNDALATLGSSSVLFAFGPEVFVHEAATREERRWFNHGLAPIALAGHPRDALAAVVVPGELWLVSGAAGGSTGTSETIVHQWPP